jgi:transposase
LASLVIRWRHNRVEGDETLMPRLEAWRKRDLHLLQMFTSLQRSFANWRTTRYRQWASELGKRYKTIVLEMIDYRAFTRRAAPEQDITLTTGMRYNRSRAASAELAKFLGEVFGEENARLIECDWTTQTCPSCHQRERFDAAKNLSHTCTQCGASWDQDVAAAQNLVRRYLADPSQSWAYNQPKKTIRKEIKAKRTLAAV